MSSAVLKRPLQAFSTLSDVSSQFPLEQSEVVHLAHSHKGGIRSCSSCGATDTPQWRQGPAGPQTLCNACGVRHSRLARRARHNKKRAAHKAQDGADSSSSGDDSGSKGTAVMLPSDSPPPGHASLYVATSMPTPSSKLTLMGAAQQQHPALLRLSPSSTPSASTAPSSSNSGVEAAAGQLQEMDCEAAMNLLSMAAGCVHSHEEFGAAKRARTEAGGQHDADQHEQGTSHLAAASAPASTAPFVSSADHQAQHLLQQQPEGSMDGGSMFGMMQGGILDQLVSCLPPSDLVPLRALCQQFDGAYHRLQEAAAARDAVARVLMVKQQEAEAAQVAARAAGQRLLALAMQLNTCHNIRWALAGQWQQQQSLLGASSSVTAAAPTPVPGLLITPPAKQEAAEEEVERMMRADSMVETTAVLHAAGI